MKNTLPLAVLSIITVVLGLSILSLSGCGSSDTEAVTPPMPVKVFDVITRDLPEYYDYVGTTESTLNVDIRARVKGYLEQRLFEEGDDVGVGQPLYVIEQRQYKAELDMAKAQLAKDQATAMDARLEKDRHLDLFERNSVSASERDKYVAQSMAAQSQVAWDEALVRNTGITLSYTSVASPIDGRISRTYVHVGNLVGTDGDTLL
ncbi:MAG: efflux RND transporter periplasmic adaptor subunit, partial [Planctomycetia bacterium]